MKFQLNNHIQLVASECAMPLLELEPLVSLHPHERAHYHLIRAEHRKREWLWVRYLLQQHKPGAQIHYQPHGKPFLAHSALQLGITHTGAMAALAWGECDFLGIDIEPDARRVDGLKHKFCTAHELALCPDTMTESEFLLALWRAKEAVYKAAGLRGIDFREQLNVREVGTNPFSLRVELLADNAPRFWTVNHHKLADYTLSWTSN